MRARTDRNDDLPLLTWSPPKRVVVIPPSRCRWLVEEIVDQLDRLCSQKARDVFWRRRCLEISGRLELCGEDEVAISRHLNELYHACQGELRKRSYQGGP